MKIELLSFDGCPNTAIIERRLVMAAHRLGLGDLVVDRIEVTGPEAAERLAFIGSPSLRIDGRDPFSTGDEPVGFACRVYSGPDGLSGSPTVDQLVEALAP